jgi:hypothetical protein
MLNLAIGRSFNTFSFINGKTFNFDAKFSKSMVSRGKRVEIKGNENDDAGTRKPEAIGILTSLSY